jgi:tetratricopeptide (TPR) repeat protein
MTLTSDREAPFHRFTTGNIGCVMAFSLSKPARDKSEAPAADLPRNAQQLLSAADQARDERRWTEAVELYGQYLVARPNDPAIWVQLGHAFKESGNLDEAEGAYRQSLELAPEVADTQLRLGRVISRNAHWLRRRSRVNLRGCLT